MLKFRIIIITLFIISTINLCYIIHLKHAQNELQIKYQLTNKNYEKLSFLITDFHDFFVKKLINYFGKEEIRNNMEKLWNVKHFVRGNHIKFKCHFSNVNKINPGSFILDHKTGTSFCFVHKIASSSMLALYNELIENESVRNSIRQSGMFYRVKYHLGASLNQLKNHMGDYYWFILVRHPFSRFLSGFRDRILSGCTDQAKIYIPRIFNYLESEELYDQNGCLKKFPTFSEFSDYFINNRDVALNLDPHFTPINDLCSPCLINFDAVYKIDEDDDFTRDLFQRTGLSVGEKNLNPTLGGKSSGGKFLEFYEKLNCKQIKSLSQLFYHDLVLFNYTISSFISNCS